MGCLQGHSTEPVGRGTGTGGEGGGTGIRSKEPPSRPAEASAQAQRRDSEGDESSSRPWLRRPEDGSSCEEAGCRGAGRFLLSTRGDRRGPGRRGPRSCGCCLRGAPAAGGGIRRRENWPVSRWLPQQRGEAGAHSVSHRTGRRRVPTALQTSQPARQRTLSHAPGEAAAARMAHTPAPWFRFNVKQQARGNSLHLPPKAFRGDIKVSRALKSTSEANRDEILGGKQKVNVTPESGFRIHRKTITYDCYSHDRFSKCFPVVLGFKQGVSKVFSGKIQKVGVAGSAGRGLCHVTLWSFLSALDVAYRLPQAEPWCRHRAHSR